MRSVSGINNSVTAAYAAYDPLSNKQLIASIRKPNPSAKKKEKAELQFQADLCTCYTGKDCLRCISCLCQHAL